MSNRYEFTLAINCSETYVSFTPASPGPWMNKLRLVLAAMMLASCFWLLSLLTSFIGSGWTLFFVLLIVIGLLFSYARHHLLHAALTVAS